MIAKAKIAVFASATMVANLRAHAGSSVALIWDPSPSPQAVGYKIYCVMPDGSGKASYDVGNTTNAVMGDLVAGQTYNFYATSYDSSRNESGPSNTLAYTVPQPTNQPPALAAIPNQLADESKPLQFTVSATDPDTVQTLSFSLGSGPGGATIDKRSGLFSWTPLSDQAPSTNAVTVVVTDNGQPPLSASRSFNIIVREGFYLYVTNVVQYGSVQVNPRGSLNSAGTKYISGTSVAASAAPANAYTFDHWTLDEAPYGQNPLAVTMNKNHNLAAIFFPKSIILGVCKYHSTVETVTDEVSCVNTFVDIANGKISSDPYVASGKWYDLINNPTPVLPSASSADAQTALIWTSSVTFPVGSPYNYVLAEFGSQWGDIDVIYYSSDGAFSIPSNVSGCNGIRHYTAFRTAAASQSDTTFTVMNAP